MGFLDTKRFPSLRLCSLGVQMKSITLFEGLLQDVSIIGVWGWGGERTGWKTQKSICSRTRGQNKVSSLVASTMQKTRHPRPDLGVEDAFCSVMATIKNG